MAQTPPEQSDVVWVAPGKVLSTVDDDAATELFGTCSHSTSTASEGTAPPVEQHEQPAAFTADVHFLKGRSLGMSFDITRSDFLRIKRVDSTGPVADYNRGAPKGHRIEAGDFVVAVSGVHGSARDKLGAILMCGLVALDIRRPQYFQVAGLDRSRGKLGLNFSIHSQSSALYISEVLPDGLVQAHNDANGQSPSWQVRAGDLVTAVNETSGTSAALMSMIEAGAEVSLTITRPAEP